MPPRVSATGNRPVVAAGQTLGNYQIVSLIGAGGMGEVYRARDRRLERDVAIKVLPARFAEDADRLRRFEQEARAAAALNHTNILAVYELGVHEGAPYVVTELLEGETLRDALRAGPLPARKALDYAMQIARGLAAAHDKGIVHRDLKPENLFLPRDGGIKILDFGLAKLTHAETAGAATSAPTMPSQTDPGTVMGTMGYMSPEQVRGLPTDHRTDIFTLGAILYEMLSGRRAFRGETPADTASAILREDPPEISDTVRNLPPGAEHIVRHCMEKNPAERFQSARDLAFDLERLSGISGATSAVRAAEEAQARARWRPLLTAAALLALVAAAFVAGRNLATGPAPTQSGSHRLTFRRGFVWTARFAPDGRTIVYGATWDGKPMEVFSTRPESPESRSLGFAGADLLAISSTGELAILLNHRFAQTFASRGTLARVPLAGGAPREVLEDVAEADWSPDGSSLAVVRYLPQGGQQLEYPIGKALYSTRDGFIGNIRISPKGDLIAFLDHPGAGDDQGFVAVVDRDGKVTRLVENWSERGLAWSPTGDEIWYTAAHDASEAGRSVYAISFSGKVRVVHRDVGVLTLADVSRDGRMLLAHESERRGIIALSPEDATGRDWSWFDRSFARDLSADGKTILFDETGEGGGPEHAVFLRRLDGSPPVRLGGGFGLSLSPDTKWAMVRDLDGKASILPTGAGEAKPVPVQNIWFFGTGWFPDGKRLFLVAAPPTGERKLYLMDFPGGEVKEVPSEAVPGGPRGIFAMPDGEHIAVATVASSQCSLLPIRGGAARPIPCPSGPVAGLSADGKAWYVREGGVPASLYRTDVLTGRKEFWKEVAPPDPAGTYRMDNFLVTPDGKTIVYTYRRILSDLYLVEGMK
ncbi:MAG TPA: protein kinase [Terriglobales bacterium]|nr:protein kinase [Terriglobales bacterium]